MIVNVEHNRIRERLELFPATARFTVCTRCWNIVQSVRGGAVINNGSGYCRETIREVSKQELLNLLQCGTDRNTSVLVNCEKHW